MIRGGGGKGVENPYKRETKARQGARHRRQHYVHFLFPLHCRSGKITRQSK